MDQIYLDYAATTPVDPRVLDAMLPYFRESFGNPSSVHRYGQRAEAAVEQARETVAVALNCAPSEVIFTSCGSESDNLALRGAVQAMYEKSGREWILTSQAEHHAVTKTAEQLAEHYRYPLEWLDVDEHGMVTPETVGQALCDNTTIVSVMYANNEIGTINPIKEIADICHQHGALFHTDAVQAAGYLPVDVTELGADLISLGGHKFYGPKGVGALYVRKGTPLLSQVTGGGQEHSLRAGTSNVPYIVGFAEALRLSVEERDQRISHVKPLRDRIIGTVLEEIPDSRLTGHPESRLPNHASFAFKGVDGNTLLQMLDAAGFACSSGSACKTGNPEPSEVMTAIGLSREWGLGSLRVTLGSGTTAEHVESFLQALPSLVEKVRKLTRDEQGRTFLFGLTKRFMDKSKVDTITEKIIGAVHKVSNTLGIGFVEKVYENGFTYEMRKAGLTVDQQHPIKVTYDEIVVGKFFVDLLVEEIVLVELKSVSTLNDDHMMQALNYLCASGLPACLLINFGTPRAQIRRLHPSPKWKTSEPSKYVKT